MSTKIVNAENITMSIEDALEYSANYEWTLAGGKTIRLREMRWSHLVNILRYPDAHPSVSKHVLKKFHEVRPHIWIEMFRREIQKIHE